MKIFPPLRIHDRLSRLEQVKRDDYRDEGVLRIARQLGFDADELVADADRLTAQFRAAGATTEDQRLRLVAADLDITVDDLRRELHDLERQLR
jgi:hypothetical protein